MVLPTSIIKYSLELINDNKSKFPEMADPVEGSEDTDINTDNASIIAYADFDETASLDTNKRALHIPCSLYFICNSNSFETATESFLQALEMALTLFKIISVNNRTELKNTEGILEPVHIQAQDVPITILSKSAKGSSVQCNFKYNISRI